MFFSQSALLKKGNLMKRKIILPVLLLTVASLTSCGEKKPTSIVPEPGMVQFIRDAEVGSEHTVSGVVVQHVYTGQTTPYITGFMLANDSGCIYIYGETVAKSVKVGDKVTVKGTKAYYVPQTDTGAAESTGYKGQLQLTNPEVISHEEGNNEIPTKAITEIDHLAPIIRHDLTDDISNQLYRIKGRISRAPNADYVNYYLHDVNREDSIAFYTQSNGKDYAWLDAYDGKAVDMTFITINAKPGNALWRGLPVKVNGEVTITAKEEAEYAADRGLAAVNDKYSSKVDVKVSKTDEYLKDITFQYKSDSELVKISEEGDQITLAIAKPDKETKVKISVTVTYEGATVTKSKEILIGVKSEHKTISIAEARSKETGTEVIVEGVIGRKTYKGGSEDPLGAFIIDETGSIVIYNDGEFMPNLAKVVEGNRVILKGTLDRYINTENVGGSGYTGDIQIRNVTVLDNDGGSNEIPTEGISEQTVAWISSQKADNNISGNVYKVRATIIKNAGPYTSYNLGDPDSEAKLLVYSQRSGSEFAWLDAYAGKVVTLYVGVQNLQLKSGGTVFNWRCCPIAILS